MFYILFEKYDSWDKLRENIYLKFIYRYKKFFMYQLVFMFSTIGVEKNPTVWWET